MLMINHNRTWRDQPGIGDLITIEQAAELSGFTSRHIRKLAKKGGIWAVKLGRNWFTTAQTIQEYLDQERKPGPKRKISL